MPRTMRAVAAAAALLAALSASGARAIPPVPDTPVVSGNVTLLGNIPDVAAIGGQVRTVSTLLGPKRYLVMTTLKGVSAYDVTVPEAPVLATTFPLPHIENEDVTFGGNLLLVSVDPSFTTTLAGGIYVLDISKLPAITFAYVNAATANRWTGATGGSAGHTVTCVKADCSYAIVNGTSSVKVVSFVNPAAPVLVKSISSGVGSTHDAQVDEAGLVWMVGSGGVNAWDFTDPVNPRLVVPAQNIAMRYHHNSWRPRATSWGPRTSGTFNDPAVRDGELVLVTEEEWAPVLGQTLCIGQGRFETRWVRDTDSLTSGATPTQTHLDDWQTELQAAGIVGPATICSAHYFDERDKIVAIGWYNQGTRFLDVSDPRNIRQVGYYINPTGTTWSAKWIGPGAAGGEIVYTIDATRGIDVLRFDRTPPLATVEAPILDAWLSGASPVAAVRPHPTFGWQCSIPRLS